MNRSWILCHSDWQTCTSELLESRCSCMHTCLPCIHGKLSNDGTHCAYIYRYINKTYRWYSYPTSYYICENTKSLWSATHVRLIFLIVEIMNSKLGKFILKLRVHHSGKFVPRESILLYSTGFKSIVQQL